jgi:hypothetical protein
MSEQNIETALRHLKAALALLEKSQSKKKKNPIGFVPRVISLLRGSSTSTRSLPAASLPTQ